VGSAALRFTRRFLVGLGLGVVVCVGGTVAYGSLSQRYRSWKFDREVAAPAVAATGEAAVALREGDLVGRLEIPRIGLSVMVFQGTGEVTLIRGAGHVPGTPSPGADGNVVIAAHRDTFFRKLEGIRAGDRIRIATVGHTFEYVVASTETVEPEETRVMESRGRSELTLITCYPFHFVGAAPHRFIVHARPL